LEDTIFIERFWILKSVEMCHCTFLKHSSTHNLKKGCVGLIGERGRGFGLRGKKQEPWIGVASKLSQKSGGHFAKIVIKITQKDWNR
jgi:hypothetical protein